MFHKRLFIYLSLYIIVISVFFCFVLFNETNKLLLFHRNALTFISPRVKTPYLKLAILKEAWAKLQTWKYRHWFYDFIPQTTLKHGDRAPLCSLFKMFVRFPTKPQIQLKASDKQSAVNAEAAVWILQLLTSILAFAAFRTFLYLQRLTILFDTLIQSFTTFLQLV